MRRRGRPNRHQRRLAQRGRRRQVRRGRGGPQAWIAVVVLALMALAVGLSRTL